MSEEREAVMELEGEIHEEMAQDFQVSKEELEPHEKEGVLVHARRVIEGLLFSSSEPVTLRRIANVLQAYHPLTKEEIKGLLDNLAQEYEEQNRAFRLAEIAKGYILRTTEELSPYIHAYLKTSRPERLSHAATEVLAIIAYRGPVTRPQIDDIRGVDSSGIVSTLIERELIEPAGKLEVPGRPTLYGVSQRFLKYFGLKDLKDLPDLGISQLKAQRQEKSDSREQEARKEPAPAELPAEDASVLAGVS